MSVCLTFEWNGEAMVPLTRYNRLANKLFVVGETYSLAEQEDRSGISHRHFFACINEAWMNLPDDLALEFTSAERLRKRALIATGYYTERRLTLSSPAEARKTVSFLMQRADDGTVFSVSGNVVIERTARSQSMGVNGMRKTEFQKSKTDVLDWIAALLRVELEQLAAQASGTPLRMAG